MKISINIHFHSFYKNDNFILETPPQKNFSFPIKHKKTQPYSLIKNEEKPSINFNNYYYFQDKLSENHININPQIPYSFPREEKKMKPSWQDKEFFSEKKYAFNQNYNKNSLFFLYKYFKKLEK